MGVELTNTLSWNKHVDSITKKGIRCLGFLHRNLSKCPRNIKTTCYNNFVRPIVEYASCVWDPHTKRNSAKIETVERNAARFVMNNYSRESSVTTMLEELKWESLDHRRGSNKVSMMYRINNHLIDIADDQLISLNTPARGHNKRFIIPKTRTTLLTGAFFPETIRLWNCLPQNVVNSPSLDVFKTRIKDIALR